MRRVLLADDSAVARLSVARRLRASGAHVVEEESAAAASSVDPGELTCALLDLDLGDGWGTDVAERLRDRRPLLPIAFFTSTTSGEALARARSFGPVFTKPGELGLAIAWVTKQCA